MPANIVADMNSLSAGLEDQRALQIALELTKLGLNDNDQTTPPSANPTPASYDRESEAAAMRKSANMTECVPVPSSEHVAEIVGRQGCKIKALRAKTNTYIKTPVRGEEPVFVVTGRKEDVGQAKREILSAAEHFSQIRASRRNNNAAAGAPGTNPAVPGVMPGPGNPNLPGHATIQVRVPYRVVGLVVGPKGATIKRIQQQTHTYIVTPNRDKEPIFEVTGLPENVEQAREEIEGHIAMRTGGINDGAINNHLNNMHSSMGNLNLMPGSKGPGMDDRSDFQTNGIDAGFHELNNSLMFNSLYNKTQPGNNSAFTPYNKALNNNQSNNIMSQHMGSEAHDTQLFPFASHIDASLSKFNDMSSLTERITNGSVGLYDSDEGIGGSPTFDSTTLPINTSIWSDLSSESQNSEFGTLFTSLHNSGGNARHMGMNGSPGLSLPQMNFSTMPSPGMSADMAPHSPSTAAMRDEASRRINPDPLNLSSTLALLQHSASVPASLQMTTSPGNSTLTSTCTSVSSSLSLSESSLSSLHSSSASSSPTDPSLAANMLVPPPRGRHCMMCSEGDIVAALVPCGHNMFCMDCATRLVQDSAGHCPICQQAPSQAIRIFS